MATPRDPTRPRLTLRLLHGGMPMNDMPMSAQDASAFGGVQDTFVGSAPSAPSSELAATKKYGRANYGAPGNTFQPMGVPQLRDGGEVSPWSLRGIIGNVKSAMTPTPPTPEQAQRAKDLADYKARAEAARNAPAQPAPAAAAPAPTGISGYVGNSALQARERAAGLRDGGDLRTGQGGNVPGTGSGDKIPAKYEPGEFVVSNAMLDAAPGLREELHDLRGNVLAKQGKSVAQADAEAVTPKGLRANKGGVLDPDYLKRAFPNGAQDLDLGSVGKQPSPQAMGGAAQRVVPPVADPAVPKYTPPKVDPSTGRYVHESVQRGAGAGAGSGGGSGVRNTVLQGLKAQPGFGSKAGYLAGRVLSSPVTRFAGKAAGAAGVIQNFNDYKINDPEVDSSNSGTMRALGNGDFAGAGRSFSKGALEASMDLGSFAANTADLFVPGQGPSKAYNRMLRDAFGDQLIDRSGNGPEGVQPRAASTAQSPSRPINHMGQNFDDPRLVNADPSRANLGASRDFTNELGAVPKDLPSDLREGVIHKTIGPNGTTVYSGRNVGADAQFVDGMGKTITPRGNVMSSSALREGASSDPGVSAALAAAAARGDMDSVRAYYANKGESFGGVSAAQYREQQEDAKAPKPGQPGYRTYMDAKMTKRGQDLDYDAALRGHEVTKGSAKYNADTALRDQSNKDREFQRNVENDSFAHREAADKNLTAKLDSMFTTRDDKGNSVVDHDRVASHKAGITAYLDSKISALERVPRGAADYATSQRAAAALRKDGAAGLGEDGLQKLIAQLEVQRRSAGAGSSWNPLGGRHVDSANPEDYDVVGVEPGLMQDQYKLKGGGRVPTRILDFDNGGNAIIPNAFGNSPTRRFDTIKRDLRNGN